MPPNPSPSRAHPTASMAAGVLALLIAVMFVCFAVYNVVYSYRLIGFFTGTMVVNMVGGITGAAMLVVTAGFTFIRRVPAAWTLCVMCSLMVVANFALAPLLWGIPVSAQARWIFSFDDIDSTVVALAMIMGVFAAVVAAIAASVKTSESVGN